MAAISDVFIEYVKDLITRRPLENGELRKIKGLEGYGVSLSPEMDGMEALIEFNFNDSKCYIFRL